MIRHQTQTEHDALIKFAAEYLKERDFRNVMADLAGYGAPQKITCPASAGLPAACLPERQGEAGHIPDITAEYQHLNIFEVETADSIDDAHTAEQWKLFANYARDTNVRFWVVVPSGSVMSAHQRLKTLRLTADVWGIEIKN